MIDEIDEIEDSLIDPFEDECLDALDILYDLRHSEHSGELGYVYICMLRLLHKAYPDNYVEPNRNAIENEWLK